MDDSQQCTGHEETCDSSVWQPPKLDRHFWFVFVGLTTVWALLTMVQNWASSTVIAVVMLTWLFGCPRTKRATRWVAAAMYVPFAWLLLTANPWNDYHWTWFGMWGHGFGILPAKLLAEYNLYLDRGTWPVAVVASLITTLAFLASVSLIRFWPGTRWWVLTVMLALSGLMSFGCYGGFRM